MHHLRCRYYPLADRAVMRLFSSNSVISSLSCSPLFGPILSSPKGLSRHFHVTFLRYGDTAIFSNSLERTLNAHRSSNRAKLVRKVVSKKDPEGIYRPVLPPENYAGYESPKGPSSSEATPQLPQSNAPVRRTQREPGSLNTKATVTSRQTSPYQQLQWDADVTRGRPEQSPWLAHLTPESQSSDSVSQLDAEIRALEKYLAPTPPEQDHVDQLVADITGLLTGIVPNSPQVIGSWRTGFALSHSNLDFVLPVPDSDRSIDSIRKPSATRPKALGVYNELLHKVEHTLKHSSLFSHIHIWGKRGSVLTAIHRPTGRQLLFQCGEGLPSSIEYIKDYHAEYPSIRPLYMTTRLILEIQNLFGRRKSSIESDALLILLVAFLRMNHGRFRKPGNLGSQLLAFLQTYGTEVNLRTTGVSVDPPSFFNADTFKRSSQIDETEIPAHLRGQRSLINLKKTAAAKRNFPAARRLCIQDPANYMNDLGRTCTRTNQLQLAFSRAYVDLNEASRLYLENGQQKARSILTHALRANFDDFERLRARVVSA